MKDLWLVPKNSLPASWRGQSLVEALVAVALAVLIVTGVVVTVIVAVRNAQFAKNQALATKYANEGMEKVRAYRDGSVWSAFTGGCNGYSAGSIPASFTRTITCQQEGAEKTKVTVAVSWVDSIGTHKSELVSYFTKWK